MAAVTVYIAIQRINFKKGKINFPRTMRVRKWKPQKET